MPRGSSLRELAARLSTIDLDRPAALRWLVPALRDKLRFRCAHAYRLGRDQTGWQLDFAVAAGHPALPRNTDLRTRTPGPVTGSRSPEPGFPMSAERLHLWMRRP